MLDRLGELEVFLAIAESGSLSNAAKRLRKSLGAVSRILAELEERIGVVLVDRTTRRCVLTASGKQFAVEAGVALSKYEDAIGSASADSAALRGKIRLTAPVTFGRSHVSPLLVDFLNTNELLAIELDLSDRVIDLHHEDFDLAVRIGRVNDTSLISREVGSVSHVVVASPQYLKVHGCPLELSDLPGHRIVQHSGLGLHAPWLMRNRDGSRIAVSVASRFAVNQADAAIDAALQGNGLVRVLSYQVDHHLRSGELVRVLRTFEPLPLAVNLVRPESRRLVLRVKALSDYLCSSLSRLQVLEKKG